MNKQETIPVFFSVDDAYAPFLAVALHSAVQNASPDRRYAAIILHQGLSEENQRRLADLATAEFTVKFVPMGEGLEAITDQMGHRLRCDYFTLTIYFRLLIPRMFPQYDKGIYIDSDVVVQGDLADLFDTDLGDNYLGACNDLSVMEVPPLCTYIEEAVGVHRREYINSGVLLMNLEALRRAELDRHFLSLLTAYGVECIAPDQDYLNALCNGRIHYLEADWDAMPNPARPPLKQPRLIHYNLFSKPWCYDGIQYEEAFWAYVPGSGYEREIRAYKAGYTAEQRESDARCMELLAERGLAIAGGETTFRSLHEKGVHIRL